MPEGLTPFMQHPEVAAEKEKYAEALEAERLAFEYKSKREEMLTIFDEIKEYMSYEDLSDYLAQENNDIPQDLRAQIIGHFEEMKRTQKAGEEAKKHPIIFQDFKSLVNTSIDSFSDCLYQSVEKEERAKASEIQNGHAQDQETIDQEVFYRTVGKNTRFNTLVDHHFIPLGKDIAAFSEEELSKIKAYGLASYPEVRTAIKDVQAMREGIAVTKEAKTPDVVRAKNEIAAIHNTDEESVGRTFDRLSRIIKKNSGQDFVFSIEEKYDQIGNLVDKDFITAYVNYNHEMKSMHHLLADGRIVETEYVKELIEEMMPALTKNPPKIVYLHGDFGTGKTALATHVSKTRFGKDPIIVSGSKFLEPDRFTEEFQIRKLPLPDHLNQLYAQMGIDKTVGKDTSTTEILTDLVASKEEMRQQMIAALKVDYPKKIPQELLDDIDKQLENLYSNSVQGQYILGAMYEAMNTGTPLIMDEANAISPDVMIAFNDLLTKKIGQEISTRTAQGEISVKDGFCVMWTGNTGKRYQKARFQDIDPASLSRIMPINVRYLPNNITINNFNALFERLELNSINESIPATEEEALQKVKDSKEKALQDQIFQVLLCKTMESRLGAEFLVRSDDPYSFVKDLYRLSAGARIIQHMFEGEYDPQNMPEFSGLANIVGDTTPTTILEKMQKSNLTMRELIDDIVGGYQDEGGALDIEYYLFKFVQKYNQYPQEQAILYSILKQTGFFENSEGWPDYTTCANEQEFKNMMQFNAIDNVEKYKKIRKNGEYATLLNTNGDYHLQYFSSPEMLQLLFGYLPPRRPEEYDRVLAKEREIGPKPEMSARQREILTSASEIRESLRIDLFQTSDQAENLLGQIRSFKFANPETSASMSDEEFLEEADRFCNTMLQFLVDIGKINQEAYDSAQQGSVEQKMELIKQALK